MQGLFVKFIVPKYFKGIQILVLAVFFQITLLLNNYLHMPKN